MRPWMLLVAVALGVVAFVGYDLFMGESNRQSQRVEFSPDDALESTSTHATIQESSGLPSPSSARTSSSTEDLSQRELRRVTEGAVAELERQLANVGTNASPLTPEQQMPLDGIPEELRGEIRRLTTTYNQTIEAIERRGYEIGIELLKAGRAEAYDPDATRQARTERKRLGAAASREPGARVEPRTVHHDGYTLRYEITESDYPDFFRLQDESRVTRETLRASSRRAIDEMSGAHQRR